MSQSALTESVDSNPPKRSWIWFGLIGGLVLIFVLSLSLGRYPQTGFVSLTQLRENELAKLLVFNVRLPRLLTALLLGMVMASAGTVFQMIFANPLVEPGFLGVSQGAAFGAALGIVFLGASSVAVQGLAIVFCFPWVRLFVSIGAAHAHWRLVAALGVGGDCSLGTFFGWRGHHQVYG